MCKILMNKMREPFAYILCPLYNPLNQIVIFKASLCKHALHLTAPLYESFTFYWIFILLYTSITYILAINKRKFIRNSCILYKGE